jgi:hypothetical protein
LHFWSLDEWHFVETVIFTFFYYYNCAVLG